MVKLLALFVDARRPLVRTGRFARAGRTFLSDTFDSAFAVWVGTFLSDTVDLAFPRVGRTFLSDAFDFALTEAPPTTPSAVPRDFGWSSASALH